MRKPILSGAQAILVVAFCCFLSSARGQNVKPYIGIHGGINFSKPDLLSGYDLITMIDDAETEERNYDPMFSNFGNQLGFSLYLELNDYLLVGFLPEMVKYSYGYSSYLEFFDSQGELESTYRNETGISLNYINFPLLVQYQILKETDWSPYLFAGGSYAILRNAQHTVASTTILETENGPIEFYDPSTTNSSTEFIRSKWDLFGGIGGYYDFSQFRLALDISYRIGLHNIVNESNRYNNQSISGSTYDISDDIRLNHLVANLSVLFPINKKTDRGSLDCVLPKRRKK
ncbi:MAG: porin family protein [Bacteroidales bacterium]|jgi:hypothetical protein